MIFVSMAGMRLTLEDKNAVRWSWMVTSSGMSGTVAPRAAYARGRVKDGRLFTNKRNRTPTTPEKLFHPTV